MEKQRREWKKKRPNKLNGKDNEKRSASTKLCLGSQFVSVWAPEVNMIFVVVGGGAAAGYSDVE